jgi:dCTP deaminase
MAVWSGDKLRERLPDLIDPFDESRIDCASYVLRVGSEIYVSPSSVKERKKSTIDRLQLAEDRVIPPGQFAFLITEEIVSVPTTALALISIKAKIKWLGLVNVSGFHVDPGYQGRLIFAVFNAGPSTIHLRQGDPCFLIWYLDLDRETSEARPAGSGYLQITADLVSRVSGEWKSFDMFESRMRKIESAQRVIYALLGVLVAFGASLLVMWIREDIDIRRAAADSSRPAVSAPAGPKSPIKPKAPQISRPGDSR